MKTIPITNPYGAPVYSMERTPSTMDEARSLAARGVLSGTVIMADMQEAGRGRIPGRTWTSAAGESLLCTAILRYATFRDIPAALSLRAGLAAARTIELVAPELEGRVRVKWPNDVLVVSEDGVGKKVCGILCESDGAAVYIGSGFNLLQEAFPAGIAGKASSIRLETGRRIDRTAVLETYLGELRRILDPSADAAWREELEARLYRRGQRVEFEPGLADSGRSVFGVLEGIGPGGELLIRPDGEVPLVSFPTGELRVYARN